MPPFRSLLLTSLIAALTAGTALAAFRFNR